MNTVDSQIDNEVDTFLRQRDVLEMFALSKSALNRAIAAGLFPEPVQVGIGAQRWSLRELRDHQRKLLEEARARTPEALAAKRAEREASGRNPGGRPRKAKAA